MPHSIRAPLIPQCTDPSLQEEPGGLHGASSNVATVSLGMDHPCCHCLAILCILDSRHVTSEVGICTSLHMNGLQLSAATCHISARLGVWSHVDCPSPQRPSGPSAHRQIRGVGRAPGYALGGKQVNRSGATVGGHLGDRAGMRANTD
jgi:hypothetical protein